MQERDYENLAPKEPIERKHGVPIGIAHKSAFFLSIPYFVFGAAIGSTVGSAQIITKGRDLIYRNMIRDPTNDDFNQAPRCGYFLNGCYLAGRSLGQVALATTTIAGLVSLLSH